jgi:Leucine-rich repeat (LRR) protein
MREMTKLQSLLLSNNKITTFPTVLLGMKTIRDVDVTKNKIKVTNFYMESENDFMVLN